MVVVHNHNNNNNDETRIRPSKLSNDTAPTTTTTTTTSILYSERRDDIQTKSFSVANRHRNKSQQLRISNPMRRTKRKRQRSNFNKYNDESFLWLFLRVGFVVCFIGYTSYQTYHRLFHVQQQQQQQQQTSISTDDDNDMMSFVNTDTSSSSIQHPEQPQLFQSKHDAFRNGQTSLGSEFPNEWNVSTYALQFDAYAIAELYAQQQQQQQSHLKQPDDSHQTTNDLTLFWQAAAGLRTQFAELYGGTNAARAILDRATTTFGGGGDTSHDPDRATATTSTTTTALLPVLPSDLSVTACRIWSSRQTASTASRIDTGHNGDIRSDNIPTFRFAFGGYSVTVGRGNLFSQSFPFIMEQQLQTVFSLLGIQLLVRNAAM